MIFRLSHKLNTKIKAGPLQSLPQEENPFADWSAHLFVADRTQYIILSNTKSLYSVVMYAKGITNDSIFIDRALNNIREIMSAEGQESVYSRYIVPATASVRFAKAFDRSTTGSMNDLINHATDCLTDEDLSPYDASMMLNDVLLTALAPNKSVAYGKPRVAFKELLGKTDTSENTSTMTRSYKVS